jgi:hypothetical protein
VLALFGVAACSVVGSSLDEYTAGGGGPTDCSGGLEACGANCVELDSDPDHCGACGNACDPNLVCSQGNCAASCASGETNCDGACVDVNESTQHCGGCGQPCNAGTPCVGGTCTTVCFAGQENCNGVCADLQTDDEHCGACDQPCSTGQNCVAGSCITGCDLGQTECNDLCVDTQTNVSNCGSCGNACAVGQACAGGECKIACPGGQVECSGLCYDLQSDVAHCGDCAIACQPGEVCGNGVCSLDCPAGQTACSGSCADTQTDIAHCGGCDQPCGTNQECVNGTCQIACATQLNQAIVDPWGQAWDGLERATATYANAKSTCEAFGGRLPTATELYRVSAVQSATVGQTIHVNYLWSMVPGATAATRVQTRLSDAATSSLAETSSRNYRCVCPAPLPPTYTGLNCHGPAGQGCYGVDGEGNHYNIDVQDRPRLPKGSAIWECAFYKGRLAEVLRLSEAIQQGLGNGANTEIFVADDALNTQSTTVIWSGSSGTFALNAGGYSSFLPFRCAGLDIEPTASAAGQFTAPFAGKASESADTATALWAAANDACWAKGGHVPTAGELALLIQQGLPDGTNAWLWTSDQSTFNSGTQFIVQEVRWTGTPNAFLYSTNDVAWVTKSSTRPFRCIYYPIDTGYTGPTTSQCSGGGGCQEFTLPGGSGAKLWVDSFDRAPAVPFAQAVDACRQVGGHLASERDYLETIRAGLANGTNAWNYTSDVGLGASTTGVRANVVRWTGVDTAFTDLYSTYNSWSQLVTVRAYRCAWTNQLY